ncbi:hypothetical protein TYRP_012312 [Tyrophagus putrescentiae]|nr:hypothetical protein TYRP_012312 [Tyrophagus putrescentiae]
MNVEEKGAQVFISVSIGHNDGHLVLGRTVRWAVPPAHLNIRQLRLKLGHGRRVTQHLQSTHCVYNKKMKDKGENGERKAKLAKEQPAPEEKSSEEVVALSLSSTASIAAAETDQTGRLQ